MIGPRIDPRRMRNAFGDVIWRERRKLAEKHTPDGRGALVGLAGVTGIDRLSTLELGLHTPLPDELVTLAKNFEMEPAELIRKTLARYNVLTAAAERASRPRPKQHRTKGAAR